VKYILIILLSITVNAQSTLLTLFDSQTATPSNPQYTTNLSSYWYYGDLAMDDSPVASWGSSVGDTYNLTALTTEQPTTTTNGVLFDGGDALTASTLAYISNGNPYSIGVVCNISDTSVAEYKLIFGIRNTNVLLALGINSNGYLYAIGWDGTNYVEYVNYSLPIFGHNSYIVATYNGSNTVQLFADGVLLADLNDGVNHQNGSTTELGGDNTDNALYVRNGTLILAAEIYSAVLTEEQIAQNILYYQGLGDLP